MDTLSILARQVRPKLRRTVEFSGSSIMADDCTAEYINAPYRVRNHVKYVLSEKNRNRFSAISCFDRRCSDLAACSLC